MDIIEKMAEKYDEQGLSLKVVEEMSELMEVLVKRVNKSPELKPPLEKVIEEAGDVMFRIAILAKKLDITEAISERVNEKSKQVEEWFIKKYGQVTTTEFPV